MVDVSEEVDRLTELFFAGACPKCEKADRVIESYRPGHKKCCECKITWRVKNWAMEKKKYL